MDFPHNNFILAFLHIAKKVLKTL